MAVKLFYFIASILITVAFTLENKRQLFTLHNPDCGLICHNETEPVNLIYTRAVGEQDSLHYVIFAGGALGPPSILILHSKVNNEMLSFNWTKLLSKKNEQRFPDAITLRHPTDSQNEVVFIFTQLIEYNDTKDNANVSDNAVVENISRLMSNFLWTIELNKQGSDQHDVILSSKQYQFQGEDGTWLVEDICQNNGSLQLIFRLNGLNERNDNLPKLQFTSNNTQLNVVMNNMTVSFNGSRFAMEAAYVSRKYSSQISLEEVKSIDDEFTPGIFRMVTWKNGDSNYAQWKSVVYLSSTPSLKVSTDLTADSHRGLTNVKPALLDASLAWVWFGDSIFSSKDDVVTTSSANFSFGWPKDNFYVNSNYSSWTCNLGIGTAPQDEVSGLLILIISVGLGLPFALVIFSIIFVCFKRFKARKNGSSDEDDGSSYRRIN